jgi:hypothetical protein
MQRLHGETPSKLLRYHRDDVSVYFDKIEYASFQKRYSIIEITKQQMPNEKNAVNKETSIRIVSARLLRENYSLSISLNDVLKINCECHHSFAELDRSCGN